MIHWKSNKLNYFLPKVNRTDGPTKLRVSQSEIMESNLQKIKMQPFNLFEKPYIEILLDV